MKQLFCTAASILLTIASHAQEHKDQIYHYSSMDAMRNGVFVGDITVKDLKGKGDFGLGTYNLLDGELIALNGEIFRIVADGTIEKAEEERLIPFASVTNFNADQSIVLKDIKNYTDLQRAILEKLPSKNRFYAIKIVTTLKNATLGGATQVDENDKRSIAAFMKDRPVYKKQNAKGTLVGFYSPAFIGGLDLIPFHFHFLSTDQTFGGHFIDADFNDTTITVQLDEKNNYEVVLPAGNNSGYQSEWKSSEVKSQY